MKLKVENTMRWREAFNKEGELVKESNSRMVRWSDGSMSLHLGNEIFDVYKQPLAVKYHHLYRVVCIEYYVFVLKNKKTVIRNNSVTSEINFSIKLYKKVQKLD